MGGMLMGPRTKAECDQEIAFKQKQIADKTAYVAQMKGWYGSSSQAATDAKSQLATLKAELAQLKALRKTLK